jgi:hypothetical protein
MTTLKQKTQRKVLFIAIFALKTSKIREKPAKTTTN